MLKLSFLGVNVIIKQVFDTFDSWDKVFLKQKPKKKKTSIRVIMPNTTDNSNIQQKLRNWLCLINFENLAHL